VTDASRFAAELDGPSGSLVDLVDNLLDQGVVLHGDVVLGLAGVDLVYVRLSLLLCSVDRLAGRLPPRREPGA
jgi:hypothetical protein